MLDYWTATWQTEDDARAAADDLIGQAQELCASSWSSREVELMYLAADVAAQVYVLGPLHPFVLASLARLHEKLDAERYRELWKAVIAAENAITATRYHL